MILTLEEFLNERQYSLSLWVSLFEDNQFIGVYSDEKNFKIASRKFMNSSLVEGSPFQVAATSKNEIFVVFHEPFKKPFNIEITSDIGDARKMARELRTKHAYRVLIDKQPQYLQNMKTVFDLSYNTGLGSETRMGKASPESWD